MFIAKCGKYNVHYYTSSRAILHYLLENIILWLQQLQIQILWWIAQWHFLMHSAWFVITSRKLSIAIISLHEQLRTCQFQVYLNYNNNFSKFLLFHWTWWLMSNSGPGMHSSDADLLVLKATTSATLQCLGHCLSILQQQQLAPPSTPALPPVSAVPGSSQSLSSAGKPPLTKKNSLPTNTPASPSHFEGKKRWVLTYLQNSNFQPYHISLQFK